MVQQQHHMLSLSSSIIAVLPKIQWQSANFLPMAAQKVAWLMVQMGAQELV